MDRDPIDPEIRHAQVLAECERLINRNAVLEARLGEARIWQSSVKGTLEALLQAPDIGRDTLDVPAKTNGVA